MPQLTLVALYGEKPLGLSRYLKGCGRIAASELGDCFEPYDIRQIHATIVGLEHHAGSNRENACFRRLRSRCVEMDIPGFLESLRKSPKLPLQVQIGGFGETDRPFLSRNEPPDRRSFSIQGDKAVVIGWPRRTSPARGRAEHPMTLDGLRRSAQGFGILHAYHGLESDLDNDLFLRIGLIDRDGVSQDAVRALEQRIRRHMGSQPPLILPIGLEDLSLAVYEDDRLPVATTQILPLSTHGLDARLEAVYFSRLP